MDVIAIINAVTLAITLAQRALSFGIDAWPILKRAGEILIKGKHATKEEVAALIAQSDALSAELQAAIPPEED